MVTVVDGACQHYLPCDLELAGRADKHKTVHELEEPREPVCFFSLLFAFILLA